VNFHLIDVRHQPALRIFGGRERKSQCSFSGYVIGMHELRDFLSSGWQLWYSTRSRRELFAIVALSIGIVFAQPIYAEEQASSWITDEKLATLKTIGTDPINDLEVKGNYHWRYRAKNRGLAA